MAKLPTPNDARRQVLQPVFGRLPWWRRWLGQRSERYAAKYLRRQGYRILAANITDPAGEIDLLVLHGETLVVVEVRSVSGGDPQTAALSVDARKQRQVANAALRFLSKRKLLGVNLRFDVVALAWPSSTATQPKLLHIEGAFTPPDRYQFFS